MGLREVAHCLKRTVHLARAYAAGTGTIFEDAMTEADRLADRVLASAQSTSTSKGTDHD